MQPRTLSIQSKFRTFYLQGHLPVKIFHSGSLNKIIWTQEIKSLDFKLIFPIFIDGLREKLDPFRFMAIMGSFDLVENIET